jgi:hypothetical protein
MSGFTGETEREGDERIELLRKPFATAEIVRAIARIAPTPAAAAPVDD